MKFFAAVALFIATGVTAQGSAQGTTKEYCDADYIVRDCVSIRQADVRSTAPLAPLMMILNQYTNRPTI